MNPSTAQYVAQGFIVFGSVIAITAAAFSFHYGKQIDLNKEKQIVQKELTIMALAQDPILKLNLIENDKFNFFDFNFQNTGTSDIDVKEVCEDYYFNNKYAYGTSGSPTIYKIDNRIKKNSIHKLSINLMNSLYNIEKFKEHLDTENHHIPIFRIIIKHERIIDRKEFEFVKFYIICKNVADEGKYELVEPERFRDPDSNITKYIEEISTQMK